MTAKKAKKRPPRRAKQTLRKARPCSITGKPCKAHEGVIHGREAEELRKGIEEILQTVTTPNLTHALRELLDRTNARDSLSYLEQTDGLGGRG